MKKNFISFIVKITLVLCLMMPSAFASSIQLLQPSDTESTLAPLRDFMVVGKLVDISEPTDVKIELFNDKKQLVRSMKSQVDVSTGSIDENKIETKYKNGKYYKEDNYAALKNNPPPDLVYGDGSEMNNPANKIVVNRNKQFAATILGGVSKAFDTDYKDAVFGEYKDLQAGTYELKITAIDTRTQKEVAKCSKKIKFAPSEMVFARFSPTKQEGYPHKEAMMDFAVKNQMRVLLDAIPGYWSQSKTEKSSEVFYEIPTRWRVNDLQEYLAAKNIHGVIYNITSSSTSQSLEIGGLVKAHYLEDEMPNHHVYLYRYDIGEPELSYKAEDGTVKTVVGKIVPFDGTKKAKDYKQLMIARVEMSDASSQTTENVYWPLQLEKAIDFDTTDGVTAKLGQIVSLMGVVTPIKTDEVEVVTQGDIKESVLNYVVKNRIQDIAYTITAPDGTTTNLVKYVSLKRQYFVNKSSTSIYEFKHDFGGELLKQKGVYIVQAQGMDCHGVAVDRATQSFKITVE